ACENGACVCPATSVICEGACVDPETRFQHCGGCKKSCQRGQAGEQGKCKDLPCTAPGMFLMVDQSGSMQGPSWTAARDGIAAFVGQPQSASINGGIVFFPASANTCASSSYETPVVPLAPLSTNAGNIT